MKQRYDVTIQFGVEFDTFGLGEIEEQQPVREALVRFFAMRWMERIDLGAVDAFERSRIVDCSLESVRESPSVPDRQQDA